MGELGVERSDPRIRAVVEAAVHADRAVDPVHHAAVAACKPPESVEVEVERVEETRLRASRDPVRLDREAAALELAHERAEELMAAAGRRGLEVVEDREIGTPAARAGRPRAQS